MDYCSQYFLKLALLHERLDKSIYTDIYNRVKIVQLQASESYKHHQYDGCNM